MKNILIYLLFISFAFSSCSNYDGICKRKYYDFPRNSTELTGYKEKSESKENITAPSIQNYDNEVASLQSIPVLFTPTTISENVVDAPPLDVKQSKKISTVFGNAFKQAISKKNPKVTENKPVINSASVVKQAKTLLPVKEHRKGRFWWVWMIDSIMFLILAFTSIAYIGIFFFFLSLTMMIISLIQFTRSK